eukprot:COSAG02_NODE_1388_length_12920_cov_8.638122_2_plen_92_part_00
MLTFDLPLGLKLPTTAVLSTQYRTRAGTLVRGSEGRPVGEQASPTPVGAVGGGGTAAFSCVCTGLAILPVLIGGWGVTVSSEEREGQELHR